MWSPTGLIPWFSKLREILTLLCCITLSSSRKKPTQAQEVARRISGAIVGEAYAKSSQVLTPNNKPFLAPLLSLHKSRHTKYPSQTLIPRITLFAICLSFSSPPLLKRFSNKYNKICLFIRPFFRLFVRLLFVCLCCHVPSICLHVRLLKIYVYGASSTC